MAAYNCATFGNPALNSFNVNTAFNHNVVDTSIPPPNFSSNNVMQPAQLTNQPTGQQYNFSQPVCVSHVPSMNNIGSPFPTLPSNMQPQSSLNFNPNPKQSSPVWKNSFQNNAFVNNAFSGPSPSGFQSNMTEIVNFRNAPPPLSPENIPVAHPPTWKNNNSFNNSTNYIRQSDNVTPNHPVVFNQNQAVFPKELPRPNFHSTQIPPNTFPPQTNAVQFSNTTVWKGNNLNGSSPNNSTNHVRINNFERNQNTNFFERPNNVYQKTNVPDSKIFNNPQAVFNMSGSNVISENVHFNSNQSSYTESKNPFNSSLQNERLNHSRNFNNNNNLPLQQWNKESFNISPKKEQFGNRNNQKPFGLQFNGNRNRPLSQHNHQNLIDIQVLSDGNNFSNESVKQEDQNISSETAFTERRHFAFNDTNNFTNHKLFSNMNTNNSNPKEHSWNSFQNSSNSFGDQDNVRNKQSWMSEDIRMALKERNTLFFEAKRTKDPDVWEKYYTLKRQIDEDIRKAKSGSGFKFKNFNPRNKRPIEKDLPFNCDICDRSFATDAEYNAHCALHIKCDYAGCTFEAHPKIVFLHQKMQHETGYAEAINKLQNDEEITKWREERKRNFPTAENILKRQAEKAEREARGEVVQDQNFGRFKRQRTGPGNFRQDRFKRRDRKFRQRPRNKYSFLRENLEVQYEAMNAQNSDSDAESESHIKLPRFTGIKKELEPLPSEVPRDANNDDDVQEVPVSKQTLNQAFESQKEDQGGDASEIPISEQTLNHTCQLQDENEDLDDDSPLEIPISKVPLNEVSESFDDDDDESIAVHSQCIKEVSDLTTTETLANDDSPDNNVSVKEEENVSTSAQDNKDNSRKRRHEKNSIRKPPRPVLPSRRKNSLLGMLLQDEIRHERNVIMQCVRHIVRNKFFGIGSDSCSNDEV